MSIEDEPPAWSTWDPTIASRSSASLLTDTPSKRKPAPVAVAIGGAAVLAVLAIVAFAGGSSPTRLAASTAPTPSIPSTTTTTTTATPTTPTTDQPAPAATAPAPSAARTAPAPTTSATTTKITPATTKNTPATTKPATTTPAKITPATTTTPAAPTTTATGGSAATFATSGTVEVDSLYSPAIAAIPSGCTAASTEVQMAGASLATLGPADFSFTPLADGTRDVRCVYTYTFAALPATGPYVFSATDGAMTVTSPSMDAAAVRQAGGPTLYVQHRY